MKIIQISDTHIVPPGRGLWGFNPRANLEACVDDINAGDVWGWLVGEKKRMVDLV